jgi:CheY-like chemotaxis protein
MQSKLFQHMLTIDEVPEVPEVDFPEKAPISKQILIVDDLKVNFLLIKAMLGKINVNLTWCENGFLALDHIKNGNKTDLILMDYNMPGMDGLEATRLIKIIAPEIPVFSLSTFTENPLFDRRNAPFDGYIPKPVDPVLLLELITEKLKKKQG